MMSLQLSLHSQDSGASCETLSNADHMHLRIPQLLEAEAVLAAQKRVAEAYSSLNGLVNKS
jgi:hypothetical protein